MKVFIFYEMPLKLYLMKCSERNVSQCILAFTGSNLMKPGKLSQVMIDNNNKFLIILKTYTHCLRDRFIKEK